MLNTRKRKTLSPCPRCFLHQERCICARIPRLELKTRVSLVVHAKELKRTTNTGRLAMHALVNSEMCVRGEGTEPLDLKHLVREDSENLFLYPSEDAVELGEVLGIQNKPVHLIVPDGNWRQASKVHTRHPELSGVTRVKLSRSQEAQNFRGALRHEHFQDGMATLEAIAYALFEIEGSAVGNQLLDLYGAKASATLAWDPLESTCRHASLSIL